MDQEVLEEVRIALATLGFDGGAIAALSVPSYGRKRDRRTYKVTGGGGVILIARRFESAAEAARLAALRAGLDPRFVSVIGRHEAVLLERWIDGESLSLAQAEQRVAELGALLGVLHATRVAGHLESISTAPRRAKAGADLTRLVEAGVVAAELAARLEAELAACDPGQAQQTLVHRDFCPENIVVDGDGALHVIDTEWLGLDASGVDLGRTYARWPMPPEVWMRFLRGYGTTAPAYPGALRFWLIVMAAASAVVRLSRSPEELAVPVARLVGLVEA